MKKTSLILLLCLLTLTVGCQERTPAPVEVPLEAPQEAAVPETPAVEDAVPEDQLPQKEGYLLLDEILEGTRLFYAFTDGKLSLVEDCFQVDLFVDDCYVYRNGYITGKMEQPLAVEDGTVFLPLDFYEDFLLSGCETASLYHGLSFFPWEVTEALDHPEAYEKLLEQAELPRSMGIETLNLNQLRIFETRSLKQYPQLLEALRAEGWESPENLTYGEYLVICAGQTGSAQAADESFTQEQLAFLEEKDIQPKDVHWLRKEFFDSYPEQPDEVLREIIEGYYQFGIEQVRQRAEGHFDPGKAAGIDIAPEDRPAGILVGEEHPHWWPNLDQFDDIFNYGCCLGTAKDGVRRDYYEDRHVEISGNTIEKTYFDQYQLLKYHHCVWSADYGLLDMDGNIVIPVLYPEIAVPFADRFILFSGCVDAVDETQAQIIAADGTLLAEGANRYGFIKAENGSYIGIAGQLQNLCDQNDKGNALWLIDRDGTPVSEARYQQLYFFDLNKETGEPITQDSFRSLDRGCYSCYNRYDCYVASNQDAFFVGITSDGQEEIIPLQDVLLSAP